MPKLVRRDCTIALLTLAITAAPAWADSTNALSENELIARLESMVTAQQSRLEELQQQVDAAAEDQVEAARTEMMKAQIREVLSESEFRESLMPSTLQAGYDGGFYIRSSDDKFLMKVFGRIQVRWTHYATRSENRYLSPGMRRNDRSGFDAERVRLGVFGHAYTPDLEYYLELEADQANTYDYVLSEAWVNYKFMDELQFRAGYLTLAGMRASMTSNANYQFVDGSIVDAVFGSGYGVGARFWGTCADKIEWYLDITNGITNGEGDAANRVIRPDEAIENDNNPGIIFHTIWHVLPGDDGVNMWTQADHTLTQSPALDLGFHYIFNEDDGDNPTGVMPFPRRTFFREGGFGVVPTAGLQFHHFGLDAAMKWMGFSTTAEYVIRVVDVRNGDSWPYAPLFLATGDGSTNAQHGAYVQCGYFLPIPGMEKKLEAVARVGGISSLSGGQGGTWEYAAGLNYYLEGDNVKIQTDVTKISEVPIANSEYSLANVNDDALIWRVQLQVAF